MCSQSLSFCFSKKCTINQFIHKQHVYISIDVLCMLSFTIMPATQTSLELPLLDVSQPLSPSALASLSVACKEWGFFLIRNHGISVDLHKKLESLASRIFMLPSEVKLRAGNSSAYTPHFIASPFYECLKVSGPDFFASAKSSSEAILNEPYSEFCEVMQEHGSIMSRLSKMIIEIVLMCLGDNTKLSSEFDKCEGHFRINNYSSVETADGIKLEEADEVEALGMHTDMSCITFVHQDVMGGLQIRSREGKWMDIDPSQGNLVVNIGDLMQAWSNGALRSCEHRVVLRKRPNRFSVAFFWSFEDDKVIAAPEEILGEGNPKLYKPFKCSDYLRYREKSERGNFEKIGKTVQLFAGIKP